MRTWVRSPDSFVCGNCTTIMMPGSPLLKIYLPGLKEPKKRCAACAGEDPPADLPPHVERQHAPLTLTFVDDDGIERPLLKAPSSIKQQTQKFDWKHVQAGGK